MAILSHVNYSFSITFPTVLVFQFLHLCFKESMNSFIISAATVAKTLIQLSSCPTLIAISFLSCLLPAHLILLHNCCVQVVRHNTDKPIFEHIEGAC